jgi:tetratricopeptide (TPR) repeat protein
MSVRWKPMIILSGLFLVLGAVGLLAMLAVIVPKRAEDVLPIARADVRAGRFEQAKVRFGQALQRDPRNPKIHLELAEFLAMWSEKDPAVRTRLRGEWLKALNDAAKYGKQMPEPRRVLLADALAHEEWSDCVHWARELQPLDADNVDVHFVLACEALDQQPPSESEARAHLTVLEAAEPARERTAWVRARAAQLGNDEKAVEAVLGQFRATPPAADTADPLARIQLRLIDVARTTDPATLALRLDAFRAEAAALPADTPPARVSEVSRLIEKAQRHINTAPESVRKDEQIGKLAAALGDVADITFQKATAASTDHDLRPYQGYAEYLLYREQRTRCLEIVAQALALPTATLPVWASTVAELREIGIKAALSDASDPARFDKAAPLIEALLASSTPRYQALGHLFRGVIDLELSGGGEGPTPASEPGEARTRDDARIGSALNHLRAASEGLKDVATAQALYGVALIFTGEKGVGRQHLQEAYRMGGSQLDPRYQVWAAWSVLQAGYPESAEPIVARLLSDAQQGRVGADLAPTLHLLMAEILQARPTAESRRAALAEYQAALKAGYPRTKAIELRLVQLEALLGGSPARIVAQEGADASSEMLTILTLREQGEAQAARTRLDEARRRFSDNAELVGLDAAMCQEAGDPAAADRLLSAYLAEHPANDDLTMLRATILGGPLKKPDQARALLRGLIERSPTSTALVQLAMLEIAQKDHDAALAAIGQIRTRWSESAAPDLLEAQLALGEGRNDDSARLLDEALRKDPQNKVALFWKARLQESIGAPVEARQILEMILRDRPVKELQDGVPLATAAQWALAAMAVDRLEYGAAVARFEELVREHPADQLTRAARWNLAMARAANGDPTHAKAEVAELLRDPRTTSDERVQAADFYRRQNDDFAAAREIDRVLADHPEHAPAVSFKALTLTAQNQLPAALMLVRKAIALGDAPAGLYLLLSALENLNGPEGLKTARAALEDGLKQYPESGELIRARYQIMTLAHDPAAVATLERLVQDNPRSPARAVLVDAYRDAHQFDHAEALLEDDLRRADAQGAAAATLTARLIELQTAQAAEAANRRDRSAMIQAADRATTRILEARKAYPRDARFLELEADLALQTGDLVRAGQLAQQLADREKGSPAGPILKARIAAAAGRPDEAARAYEEALERTPTRTDFRIALGRAEMAAGRPDAAIRQASAVMEAQSELPAALVLKAQALVRMPGTPAESAGRRDQAAELLRKAIKTDESNSDAYHLLSDLQVNRGERAQGIATLENCLKALPDDDTALSMLIQRLSEPAAPGKPADAAALARADQIGKAYGPRDTSGAFNLAIAVGYHRAGRSDLAIAWGERAAARLDRPIVHLTLGDILLAQAESSPSAEPDRALLNKAIDQYDRVLAIQPDSIEAVNNKAWILHRYLSRHAEALEVAEGYARKADAAALPADFLDTLGSIQAEVGKVQEARATFEDGLRQAPDHPVLNYHMGKLIADREDDRSRARLYLDKANKGRDGMPASLARDLDQLMARLGH